MSGALRSRLAPSTRAQYDVYLRGLRASLRKKPLSKATQSDVLRYLRGGPSFWMRGCWAKRKSPPVVGGWFTDGCREGHGPGL